MPRPTKVGLPPANLPHVQTAKQMLVDAAVKPPTLAGYTGKAAQVLKYAYRARTQTDPTLSLEELTTPLVKEDFVLFLHEGHRQGLGDAEGFRSAISHFQLSGAMVEIQPEADQAPQLMSCGDLHWAAEADVVRMVAGMGYRAGQTAHDAPRPRGAITKEMALQLIQTVGELFPQAREPTEILTFAGLRGYELARMHEGDLDEDDWLLVRENKRRNARTAHDTQPTYRKKLVMPEAIAAIRRAEARPGVAPGGPLWPYGRLEDGGWNANDLNKIIKEQKAQLGWNPDLEYVVHSLRHGATMTITSAIVAQGGNQRELHDATQQVASTRKRYTDSNESRIQRDKERRE